jgi:hypothetical protein
MSGIGKGLVRGADGVLEWHGGRHYKEPAEAVKTWQAGELRLGCAAYVYGNWTSRPCGKTPKHDPDAHGRPTKCGRHCKAALDRREAKKHETFERFRRKNNAERSLYDATAALELALRKIAEGHNDPRALAQEVLAVLDAARAVVNQLEVAA